MRKPMPHKLPHLGVPTPQPILPLPPIQIKGSGGIKKSYLRLSEPNRTLDSSDVSIKVPAAFDPHAQRNLEGWGEDDDNVLQKFQNLPGKGKFMNSNSIRLFQKSSKAIFYT